MYNFNILLSENKIQSTFNTIYHIENDDVLLNGLSEVRLIVQDRTSGNEEELYDERIRTGKLRNILYTTLVYNMFVFTFPY